MSSALTLLTTVSKEFPDIYLKDTLFIGCQHILASNFKMFEILFEKGLLPKNTYVLGKCYSTNRKVFSQFKKRGVLISRLSMKYKSDTSFDEQFLEYIENFLQSIPQNKINQSKRVIVLDDGGELLLYVNDFFKHRNKIIGVEQTSSGYEKIKNIKFKFPVVNVARSSVKLKIEAPLIALLIFQGLKKFLKKDMNILVVGQGSIGKSINRLLKKSGYKVTAYDILSHKQPFPGSYTKNLSEYDVIVGATGKTILKPGNFSQLKKGVILLSASSSDREFSAVYLRRQLKGNPDCHQDIKVQGLTLLNSGFPLNFQGKKNSLPMKHAQLTRALVLAGVFQSTKSKRQGIESLDSKIQKKIAKNFKG